MGLARRQTILVDGENGYAVDPAHVAADAQLLHDFTLRINNQQGYARPIQSDLLAKQRSNVNGRRSVSVSCRQELRGNAADLAVGVVSMYHHLLLACGWNGVWNVPVVGEWNFTPAQGDSTGDNATSVCTGSVAIECNYDGLEWLLLGGRGNCRFRFVPGESAWINYDLMFRYPAAGPGASGIITPTYADDVPPAIVQSITFAPLYAAASAAQFGHVRTVEIDMRNNVVFRDSSTLGSEGLGVVSTLGHGSADDPGIGIKMEVEQPAGVAAANVWWAAVHGAIATGQTVITPTIANIVIGSAAGNTTTFVVGRFHVISCEQIVMHNGLWGHSIEGRLMASAAPTGEDDLLIHAT